MIEDLLNQAAELQNRADQLTQELEETRARIKGTLAKAACVAADTLERTKQAQLEADYKAGDKSVVRDEAAGNGAGAYRRVISGAQIDNATIGSAKIICVPGNARAEMNARIDAVASITQDHITALDKTAQAYREEAQAMVDDVMTSVGSYVGKWPAKKPE